MPRLPRKIGNKTPFGAEWDTMVDYLRSLRPMETYGVNTDHTATGVFRHARSGVGGTGPEVRMLKLDTVQGDYVTCHSWDGTTEGSTAVYVAKPQKLRESLTSETKLGVAHTYTFAAGADSLNRVRTDAWSGGSEDQYVTPVWCTDDIIWAIDAATDVETEGGSPVPVTLLMIAPWRLWMRIP